MHLVPWKHCLNFEADISKFRKNIAGKHQKYFQILYHWFNAYVPDFKLDNTDGRIQIGGTRIRVNRRSQGRPTSGFIISKAIS